MPRNRDFFRRKKNDPKRLKDIDENQFLSDYLFTELPKDLVTNFSQLYLFQRQVRADGVDWRPVRITVEDLFNADINFLSEGNSATEYLPSEYIDEGDASSTYTAEEFLNESDAFANY